MTNDETDDFDADALFPRLAEPIGDIDLGDDNASAFNRAATGFLDVPIERELTDVLLGVAVSSWRRSRAGNGSAAVSEREFPCPPAWYVISLADQVLGGKH
jgi:hypothetical protein